jgi:hypothetical protein
LSDCYTSKLAGKCSGSAMQYCIVSPCLAIAAAMPSRKRYASLGNKDLAR